MSSTKNISVAKDKFGLSDSFFVKTESGILENKTSESDHSHEYSSSLRQMMSCLQSRTSLRCKWRKWIQNWGHSKFHNCCSQWWIWCHRARAWCNCLFRVLSLGWFGSSTYFGVVRESNWDSIIDYSEKFEVYLPDEFDQYFETILEDGELGGETEMVVFFII